MKGKKKAKAKPILTTGGDEIINGDDDGHLQSVPPSQPTHNVWLAMEEEVKSMKTSQIKLDLDSCGISTGVFLERDELIHALVCDIKEEMSTRQLQQQPRCNDNQCSHGSKIDSVKKIPFFLVAFEENLGEFACKIVINHGDRDMSDKVVVCLVFKGTNSLPQAEESHRETVALTNPEHDQKIFSCILFILPA